MSFTNYGVLLNFHPTETCEYIVEVKCKKDSDIGAAYDVEDGIKLYMNRDKYTEYYGKIISVEEFNTEYEIYQVLDEYENIVYQ